MRNIRVGASSRQSRIPFFMSENRTLRIARSNPRMFLNIPIALTWLRIVLIPVFLAVYYLPDAWLSPVAKNWSPMSFFAAAALTDCLDVYLARRWCATSYFAAFLDPVADMLVV